jgi:RNA methyltransferase, TrmH family
MSISNQTLKYIKSLHLRKFRQKYNNFLAEGDKIVTEILQQSPAEIEAIYALPEWIAKNTRPIAPIQHKIQAISEEELKKISTLITPNQVLAVVKQPETVANPSIVENDLSLYLDGIQDPGNMGTILRIADWFAIKHVFCAPNCVEVFSPKVVQASMGAFLRIGCLTYDLVDLKNQFPALPIYGAVLNGVNIFEAKLNRIGILLIGNEGKGISKENEALLTQRIAIPPTEGGGAESLNAAVAAGIIVAVFRNL